MSGCNMYYEHGGGPWLERTVSFMTRGEALDYAKEKKYAESCIVDSRLMPGTYQISFLEIKE
jgi:hypothetical protein